MVERFNRRLGDHLDRRPLLRAHRRFLDHAERDAHLYTFVADYNRTRLRCLGCLAPAELLANLSGHNTKAGATTKRNREPYARFTPLVEPVYPGGIASGDLGLLLFSAVLQNLLNDLPAPGEGGLDMGII